MTSTGGCLRWLSYALAAAATALYIASASASEAPDGGLVFLQPSASADLDVNFVVDEEAVDAAIMPSESQELPPGASANDSTRIGPPDFDFRANGYADDDFPNGEDGEYYPNDFTWQVGPSGIIYRSYLAGPLEPRISITPFFSENHSYWDATVGGRGGILRYGDRDPLHPHGWQLDAYGAAVVRMDAENHQDLNSSDYVFGFPLTYGIDNWQFKMGYAHLSSHLGDEYALRNPGSLQQRINYVRDGIVFGASWFPIWACRVYGEFDWAFHNSGGSKPIAFQFGNELSRPGPTGLHGSPFLALNGRLRESVDYGGDVTAQTGWLWRGETGKTFRIGGHYYNGKSSQAQFFQTSEQQIGIGLWYDF
ncbi:MAG: DUF1207 domain-containing protein [Pirellulales bacterium]